MGWLANCPRILMGLALVHFQIYWLLSPLHLEVLGSFSFESSDSTKADAIITKGRSILFNHFIEMRRTVNLSISCRKKTCFCWHFPTKTRFLFSNKNMFFSTWNGQINGYSHQRCRWVFKSGWAKSAPLVVIGLTELQSPPCPPTSGSTAHVYKMIE